MTNAGPDPALRLVGGCARSEVWSQMLASCLNCTLQRPIGAQAAAALGAARLAWTSDGGAEAQVCVLLPSSHIFAPDAAQHALLRLCYARFSALYPVLRDLF